MPWMFCTKAIQDLHLCLSMSFMQLRLRLALQNLTTATESFLIQPNKLEARRHLDLP